MTAAKQVTVKNGTTVLARMPWTAVPTLVIKIDQAVSKHSIDEGTKIFIACEGTQAIAIFRLNVSERKRALKNALREIESIVAPQRFSLARIAGC